MHIYGDRLQIYGVRMQNYRVRIKNYRVRVRLTCRSTTMDIVPCKSCWLPGQSGRY